MCLVMPDVNNSKTTVYKNQHHFIEDVVGKLMEVAPSDPGGWQVEGRGYLKKANEALTTTPSFLLCDLSLAI